MNVSRVVAPLAAVAIAVFVIEVAKHLPPASASVGLSPPSIERTSSPVSIAETDTVAVASVGRVISRVTETAPPDETFVARTLADVLPGVSRQADWRSFTPDAVTLAPYPRLEIPFHQVRVTKTEAATTWIGRNALAGASLVAIGKKDTWFGVLSLPGSQFDVFVRGEEVRVIEKASEVSCGVGQIPMPKKVGAWAAPMPTAKPLDFDRVVLAAATAANVADVAFFYAKEAEDYAVGIVGATTGAQDYWDSLLRAYIESSNLALEQSQVDNLRWFFAGVYRTPDYTTSNDLANDMNQFTNSSTPLGQFALEKSQARYADHSVLIVGTPRNLGGVGEIVGHRAIITLGAPFHTLAHELGHNYGLEHDRDTDNVPDNNGRYNYGYKFRYTYSFEFQGEIINSEMFPGDIMSYGSVFPYFSNPEVSIKESSFTQPAWINPGNNIYALGVPTGQPRAADAARYLREQAASITSYRTPPTPRITSSPGSTTVAVGNTLTLSVAATGGFLAYQWNRDGMPIAGAASSTYNVTNATAAHAGIYTVTVANSASSVTSTSALVVVSDGTASAALANISVRALSQTGNLVSIGGFVVDGNQPKTVLIRAVGPSLVDHGLSANDVMADPMFTLHDARNGNAVIASVDNWTDAENSADIVATSARIGAAALSATDSKSAVLLTTLQPGVYSFVVSGKNGGAGVVLTEVFDASLGVGGTLVNISGRSYCGLGNQVSIGGFVISGSIPKTVLIRAVGPSLTAQGLAASEVLGDPFFTVHDALNGNAIIASNDNWTDNANSAEILATSARIGAAALAATDTTSAVLLTTLPPGIYSFVISGKNGTSGIVLTEVYDAD